MFKHICKLLPLLLCLLLMVCLLPAAYADLADSPEIEAIRQAITSGQTAYAIDSGSTVTLAGDLTIPADFRLTLTNGSVMKLARSAAFTVDGKLEVSENAQLDAAGKFVHNDGKGEVSLSNGGVIDVTGTAEINRPLQIRDGSARFIIEDGASFNYGGFNIPGDVEPFRVVQGVDLSVYSIHVNLNHTDRIYTSNQSNKPIRIEGMRDRRLYSIAFHGIDTYTLTESAEIPVYDGTPAIVDMSETTLVVPNGMTLTVNGQLIVKELVENGTVIRNGSVTVTGSTEAALRAAIADSSIPEYRLENGSSIVLGQDLTIPNGFRLKVIKGSKLVIPSGVTLTVNGRLEANRNARIDVQGKIVDNNDVSLFDSGIMDVTGTAELNRPLRLGNDYGALEPSPKFIIEDGAVFNYGGFNIRESMDPHVAIQGVDLSVYSIHSNGGDERIYTSNRSDKPIRIEGMGGRGIYTIEFHGIDTYTLTESAEIPMYDGGVPAIVDMSETTLIVPEGMTLTVNGRLIVKELVEYGTVVKGPDGVIDGEASELAALGEAIHNNETEYTIRDANSLTLAKDLVIPKGFKLTVRGGGMKIARGATLTVNGELVIRNGAKLDVAGKLMNNDIDIDGKGEIRLYNGGVIDATGTVELNRPARLGNENAFGEAAPYFIIEKGASFNMGGFNVQNSVDPYESIRGVDLSVYSIHSNVNHTDRVYTSNKSDKPVDLEGMESKRLVYIEFHGRDSYTLAASSEIPVFEDDNTPARVYMCDTTLVIPSGVTLTVSGELYAKELVVEPGGMLTVNEGGYLDVPEGAPSVAQVKGVLVNNGSLNLNETSELALTDGGVYCGGGQVIRGGAPYMIWNDTRNAMLLLPSGLTAIESEALANGGFFSVYIPSGVTSIAPDLLGGADRMIVFGEPGSEAETFANSKGFLFAQVQPAA